jgi:adenylate cyclase
MEIERKFLVKTPPPGWKQWPHARICQGYLPTGNNALEIRLRQKGSEHFITIKAGQGLSRHEVEIPISRLQFKSLWPLTKEARISKVRYRTKITSHLAELDVYGRVFGGLMTVEVEFRSLNDSKQFIAPTWFGREITGQRKFSNRSLAAKNR